MASVGILGGTFNPPHIGHLVCAVLAHEQLGLDSVLLMPAGSPPHKPVDADPGTVHRLAMCRLAADEPWLAVSEIELSRAGPSYTIDTLKDIDANDPGAELTLIVGGDMALSLPRWREPEAILGRARLAIAGREPARDEEISARLAGLGADAERVRFLDGPRLEVSSSLIRDRVRGGRSIRHLVPAPVCAYVADHGLYSPGGRR